MVQFRVKVAATLDKDLLQMALAETELQVRRIITKALARIVKVVKMGRTAKILRAARRDLQIPSLRPQCSLLQSRSLSVLPWHDIDMILHQSTKSIGLNDPNLIDLHLT